MFKIQKRKFCLSLFFLICLLLNGCASHVSKPDGPPSYYVDVSKIPNAVPRAEPLSRLGNQTYKVFGKKYYVMNSANNYRERGIASWYGTKFNRRHTSSGERYDMLAMTAAHKSLPLPTYVEVTNLKNGRKVIVKVNDRGPFEGSRIIDLSYAAARKLDMVGKGTAPVEIRAINPRGTHPGFFQSWFASNKTPHLMARPSHAKSYFLQVGAFQNKTNAEKLRAHLMAMLSMPIRIIQPNHTLYHVQIGPLQNTNMIAGINKTLKSLGLNGRTTLV